MCAKQVAACATLLIAAISASPLVARAQTSEWTTDANGVYSKVANWNNGNGPVPNGANAIAKFDKAITANRTVSVDQAATLQEITLDNSNNYALVGASGGLLLVKKITVTNTNGNGAHSITAPIVIGQNTGNNLQVSITDTNAAGLTLTDVRSLSDSKNGITKLGTGTLVLAGTNTYNGSTVVDAGKLSVTTQNGMPTGTDVLLTGRLELDAGITQRIGMLSGTGQFVLGGALTSLTVSNGGNFGGVISGSGSLNISGTGTLSLTNSNLYGGSTVVGTGAGITLGANDALPAGTSLELNGKLDLGGTAMANGFSQTVARLTDDGTGSGTVINNDGNDRTFTVANPNNNDVFSGKLLGNMNFTKDGANTLIISGETNYRGTTTIKNGTLQIGAMGSLSALNNLALQNKGAFDLNGFSSTVYGLSGTKDTLITNSGAGTPTFTANIPANTNATFAGVIEKSLSVAKAGAGTLTLTGNSNYTGGTSVNAGTLVVDNDPKKGSGTGLGDVTVNRGGTLAGNGKIDGMIDVRDGGNDAFKGVRPGEPGKSPGNLTVGGGLTIEGGGTYVWELGRNSDKNPGEDFSVISLTGGHLMLDAQSDLSILFTDSATPPNRSDPFWTMDHTWDIISLSNGADNPSSTDFGMILNGVFGAGSFTTSVDQGNHPGDVLLNYTASAVPEPSGLTIFVLSAVGVLLTLCGSRMRCGRDWTRAVSD